MTLMLAACNGEQAHSGDDGRIGELRLGRNHAVGYVVINGLVSSAVIMLATHVPQKKKRTKIY